MTQDAASRAAEKIWDASDEIVESFVYSISKATDQTRIDYRQSVKTIIAKHAPKVPEGVPSIPISEISKLWAICEPQAPVPAAANFFRGMGDLVEKYRKETK